jgi:hypothetical protein
MARLALALVAVLAASAAPVAAEIAPGTVVDASTAAQATDLLAPEVLAHYQAGDYRNTVAVWPAGPVFDPAFVAASEQNAAKLKVDPQGTIVGADGQRPAAIYGLPFRVAADDPDAGVKAIWNAYYASFRFGTLHDILALDWVAKTSLERQAAIETQMLYYDGVPPARAPKDNPLGLLSQQRAAVTSPADLNGTATLAWRFRDGDKADQSWTYVPALRRVRQVSPVNRSDGFLGSDLSQDDGAFFDGKPEDFTWKLVGEREALVLADPRSLDGTAQRKALPDGGIAEEWPPDQKVVGYQDPAWKGVAWAPVAPVLVRRKVWVVEAKPRDPNYQFERIELGLDQQSFQGAFSRKFDGQGQLLRSLQFLSYASRPMELGSETILFPASSMGYVLAENTKAGRATVTGTALPGRSVHERRIPIDPEIFALDRLGAAGK